MTFDLVVKICGAGFTVKYPAEQQGRETHFCVGYGALRPDSLPTLGSIHFDDDRVSYVVGATEPVIDKNVLPEHDLKQLLTVLGDRPPTYLFDDYSYEWWPRILRCVNRLQPLGKRRASAVVREALRVTYWGNGVKDSDSLIIVLRLLFQPRTYVHNGGSYLQGPDDRSLIPHYPVAVVMGIPIFYGGMPVDSFSFFTMPELGVFERGGELISAPIRLPKNPFRAILAASTTRAWPSYDWWKGDVYDGPEAIKRFRQFIVRQTSSLCEGFDLKLPDVSSQSELEALIAGLEAKFDAAGLLWNAETCKYVRPAPRL